jgi:phosphate:Na+ symporter
MNTLQAIVAFGGSIALLLWGVHMVQTGVQRAYGKQLNLWMGRATKSAPRAFAAGLLITAAIQSSTATGLMISSFAKDGLVPLVPGLVAMLGANVGTTLIVQALSFNPTILAPGFVLAGVWMFRHYAPGRTRDLGRTFIGLGLLLMSLQGLVAIFDPLKTAPGLNNALHMLSAVPVIALMASAALTWASHSSVAVVVLVMSLAHHNLVSPELAYILVLGANLGTAVNPVLESGTAGNPASRRLPIGNLGTRIVGSLLGMALLPWANSIMDALGSDPARAIANFHVLFNIVVAACFLPALKPYARLLCRVLPVRLDPDETVRPQYLDKSAREVPALALSLAARESLRLADMLGNALSLEQQILLQDKRQVTREARRLNDSIGQLNRFITAYVASQDQESFSLADKQYMESVLAFSTNISRAAGFSGTSLLTHTNTLHKNHRALSSGQKEQLGHALTRLQGNLRQAAALLVSGDRRSARDLVIGKDYFRSLEAAAAERHLESLKGGAQHVADVGALHLELLRDVSCINDYVVHAAAYPILARHGELLPSRLGEAFLEPAP